MLKTNSNPRNRYDHASDFLLIDKALSGEQLAYEELYKKYHERFFRFFMRLSKNNIADSEDLVQNTFISAFSKLYTFKKKAGFYTWLHSIAINVFLMTCRGKKPILVSIEGLFSPQAMDGELILERTPKKNSFSLDDRGGEIGELDRILENVPNKISVARLTQNLPPGCKRILELHDLQGLKYNEIAVKLRCSLRNAKFQRHRAITKLREAAHLIHT